MGPRRTNLVMTNNDLRLSRFAHIFPINNCLAVYHSLNQSIFYTDDEVLKNLLKSSKINLNHLNQKRGSWVTKLIDNEILVDDKYNEENLLKRFRELNTPEISIIYLLTADDCNFRCRYCFVEGNIPVNYSFSNMDITIAKQAIDLFGRCVSHNKEQKVIIYGGEPLLNNKTVEFAISYLRTKEIEGTFNNLEITVVTNGSLISEKMADFFYDNNIICPVSIDGPRHIHNEMRIYPNGTGTFDDVLNGYFILRKRGCKPTINCTIHNHNVNQLDKIVEYFATELEASVISLNPPNQIGKPLDISYELVAENLIKAFEVVREYGLYEDRMMKFIKPIVEGGVRTSDCGACGQQIVVAPNGDVGPCQAFLGPRTFFCGNVKDKNFDPLKNPTFKEWSQRTPFNMPECVDCLALSICGGGCPYNAYALHGNIFTRDLRLCACAKRTVQWIIPYLVQKTEFQ